MTTISGWGRNPIVEARVLVSEQLDRITTEAALTRGLGRSYGDSSLPAPGAAAVAASNYADRILSFDEATGRLHAEAGLSLADLNRVFLPRCWFTPVTPGTQFVTLGGMVAADVHGKNHHVAGCFGEHVERLWLRVADGRIVECSRDSEPELFRATLGGMGLTGHILEVAFRLQRIPTPWIWQESERIENLDAFIAGLREAADQWPFTVGWIDCLTQGKHLGRGILIKGRWAKTDEAPQAAPRPRSGPSVPFELPSWVLSRPSIRAFNALYYRKHMARRRRGIEHPQTFFYPLDAIENWNLMYGPQGFTQYQCVIPEHAGGQGVRRFMELLTQLGGSSFLCVIKDCGEQGQGLLSFPQRGTSIALDIPVRGAKTQQLVDRLNELVIRERGRIYLAKDTFTRREHYLAMDDRLDEFNRVRRQWDPHGKIRSAQSVRLLGDDA
ncbi:MAG: FAD-binding oxidoreductase [Planctomycetales bacterium]|nr:FAD-binding oxidoreductase [Planctomycetales bacterium]